MKAALQPAYGCAVELALDVLGGKWKTVILSHLKQHPMRYGELRDAVPGLSDKMLTQRLAELVALGLIERVADAGSVSYSLGPEGRRAEPALAALYRWGLTLARENDVRLRNEE